MIRNLLAFFAALVLTFLGVGYFLNWYQISTTPGPDGRRSVTIDLNTKKIGQDIHTGSEKVQSLIENNTKDKTDKATTSTPVPSNPNPAPVNPMSKTPESTSWWTPTVQPQPDPNASFWDARQPIAPPSPWRPRSPYEDVPLVIPPVRDR
jgi:hypothetical protein